MGMNNYAPDVLVLDNRYRAVNMVVTKVLVGDDDGQYKAFGKTFDLNTVDGRHAFCNSLPTNGELVQACEGLLKDQATRDRDELASVIQVYAQTEDDDVDRLSRVVFSGHANGEAIFNFDEKSKIVRGKVTFAALKKLAQLFPKAAQQPRHLLVLGCATGDIGMIVNTYLKMFPSLKTFWGWTTWSPLDGSVPLRKWLEITDPDPRKLPMPSKGQANWAEPSTKDPSDGYQDGGYRDSAELLRDLYREEQLFQSYFSGELVDRDNHVGNLGAFYLLARQAASRTHEIKGADHDHAQKLAEQAFRIRFWPGMVYHFWTTHKTALEAAGLKDFSRKTRKAVIKDVDTFLAAGASGKAADLMRGLRDLDPNVLDGTWLEPP